ncbi:hypothetical protein [Paracoccus fistulariae]|uniref:Uncharacterized protein n=1 Tax=Paracoccus fistulariae TaxID=658446 RepID=A0ABY7SID1_9RHOB|nr:hypothetical protein [Paracoccus fistulariae]MDB6182173.1 hypothetical protein [Paracoccus fistulariae]WCR06604.1 hypothetical protein JHX87_14120 [Paracoccus fistulariae]
MSLRHRVTSLAQSDSLSIIGIALSAAWLVLLLLFWLLAPPGDGGQGGLATLLGVMGAVLPVALIWLAIGLARAIATLQTEAQELRRDMAQMQGGVVPARPLPDQTRPGGSGVRMVAPAQAPRAQDRPAERPAQPMPRPARASDQRQHSMRFDGPEQASVTPETMIRAMNFPNGPEDTEAITALRMALKDPNYSRILRAAQDVVTLLAGRDVYMDDLVATPTDIAAWRGFGEGQRGATVAGVGAIRDAMAIEVTADYLRADEIFRDTAHHFMRQFDVTMTRLIPALEDDQIAMLADTRSARAFMLLGRVAGIFD